MRTRGGRAKNLIRGCVVVLLVGAAGFNPNVAQAANTCGSSGSHTLCVTLPSTTLSGDATVTVTNAPESGKVYATWIPSGRPATRLLASFGPSPATGDYTFVWPTTKYLDASGILRLQAGSTKSTPVDVTVSLNNGNATDFHHAADDWASYVPGPWLTQSDPTVVAVGDGPSNEPASNSVAARVVAIHPALFLFLGDVYDTGTFTEFRNHYGVSALDAPSAAATLWGATAGVTQPTMGNHEKTNTAAYVDYWHGRPLFTRFTFGGVLFLDMNSNATMSATSAQYQMVQAAVTDPSAPACIVAYWHKPAVTSNTDADSGLQAIWALLANNGGDLLLVGHHHHMVEFKPLDASYNAGTSGAHLVELISGAGGHGVGGVSKVPPGARIAWSKGGTPGLVALTLTGAGGGLAATSIGWQWQDANGNALRSGSVMCA